jgi:hypothetical protein
MQMPSNIQAIANDEVKYSTNFMRLWNEGNHPLP